MIGVTSWGRLGVYPHHVKAPSDPRALARALTEGAGLPRGLGRSYGDQALNPGGTLWSMQGLDHFIAFDAARGVLRAEAGVRLYDIQRLALAQGWMLAVTPGTQFVTLGGAIANDVHGKNHHRAGSFGDHVRALTLLRTTGETLLCGPDENRGWFDATIGGMGLTGVIAEAEIQLQRVPSPWLTQETQAFDSLAGFFALADAAEAGWDYTVAWIDCLAGAAPKGIFFRANPAEVTDGPRPKDARKRVPVTPPISLINGLSLRAFNTAYYQRHKRAKGPQLTHFEPFFYPLDSLADWNRIYGPKGFYQYQSVVPRAVGEDAIGAMLGEIARAGEGSFLAVLKTFGAQKPRGLMSFPQPGVTLALDFPNRGGRTHRLFSRLDAIVREAKGRLYAAKDARQPRALFEAGYPNLPEFLTYRDPGIRSALSRRLIGD